MNVLLRDRRLLVILSGPDGAGKTTYASVLFKALQLRGTRVLHVNFTGFQLLSYLYAYVVAFLAALPYMHRKYFKLMKVLLRRKVSPINLPHSFPIFEKTMLIVNILESVSIYLFLLLRIIIPLKMFKYKCIIMEEGIINTLANYMELSLRSARTRVLKKCIIDLFKLWSALCKLFDNIIVIYLDSHEKELLKRVVSRRVPAAPLGSVIRHIVCVRCAKRYFLSTCSFSYKFKRKVRIIELNV